MNNLFLGTEQWAIKQGLTASLSASRPDVSVQVHSKPQPGGDALEAVVRPRAYGASRYDLSLCFLPFGFLPDRPRA